MANYDFDDLRPEAAIALALNDAGARRGVLGYLASKLREGGYMSKPMIDGLPQAIERLKSEFPACWETPEQDAKPDAFQAWRQQVGRAMASRRA